MLSHQDIIKKGCSICLDVSAKMVVHPGRCTDILKWSLIRLLAEETTGFDTKLQSCIQDMHRKDFKLYFMQTENEIIFFP